MSIIAKPSKRTIHAWRIFLGSREGQEGLAWWKDRRPRVAPDPVPHLFAVSAGKVDGFDDAIDKLQEMLADEEEKQPPDEPGLDLSHLDKK
jgi:hypothetical protein